MAHFRVIEHVVRCQHTRDRPAGAELGKHNDLRLHVKQYIPKSATSPSAPGDVTLVGAHASGFPKELYEPLWDEIYEKLRAAGHNIRGVWIADQSNHGQSGILNEGLLGNDPSWWDHGRDLLFLINQYQDDIPHPIIGVGHSMGGMHLTSLSLIHPSLIDALVLIDPVLPRHYPSNGYAIPSTYRRDIWPSREEAARKFKSNKFYNSWDTRVLDRWLEYGLRDLPTEQYPQPVDLSSARPVTLATAKAQEVFTFLRPSYPDARMLQDDPSGKSPIHQDMHPDDVNLSYPFYRPEPLQTFRRLPELKPPVLYIFGEKSDLSTPDAREAKMSTTGTAFNGSGGAALGRVTECILPCGHLIPMEMPQDCAAACANFIIKELGIWSAREEQRRITWDAFSRQQKTEINDEWRARIGGPPKRPGGGAKKDNSNAKL